MLDNATRLCHKNASVCGNKKTANGALPDAAQRRYQRRLHFQNITTFRGIRESATPVINVRPSFRTAGRYSQIINRVFADFVRNSPKSHYRAKSRDRIPLMPQRKVQMSFRPFARKSWHTTNLSLQKKFHLGSCVDRGAPCADFNETPSCWRTRRGSNLRQNFSESVDKRGKRGVETYWRL
jgi:hypothetical protein